MLIRPAELEAIRAGTVTLAFRRWVRPRVLAGTRLRTLVGLVEITAVDEVPVDSVDARDARRAGAASLDELLEFLHRQPDRPVFRVGLRYAGPDPRIALREDDRLSADDRAQLASRLEHLDRASRRGSWTSAVLDAIAEHPGERAAHLAARLGVATDILKRDVRKLKELGLTESLDVGYRLSPRGIAFAQPETPRVDGAR